MEPLLNQLRELPRLLGALPHGLKAVMFLAAIATVGVIAWNGVQTAEQQQYVFTNLTPEDSAEAGAILKANAIPFKADANGSALSVPASKVYDARLLLAAAGIPRGGGVGFEIFDRGDLGVSEFTQKINLRRATEGELARTISKLAQVRTARVHVTLSEKGLYRDQDRSASAAVVVNLQPGRSLSDKELAGIRHLVSSAVPGLDARGVTVVDGRGEVLTEEGAWGEALGQQRAFERDLEKRVMDVLAPAVGAGAVVARVTASMDQTEVQTQAEKIDPEATAVRSERTLSTQAQGGGTQGGGVAGAAANQPLTSPGPATATRGQTQSSSEEAVRNFDVSRTTTTTVARQPRLLKLSLAVLLDGVNGQPRPDADLQRLGALAKRTVGFDEARGDTFEITSSPFVKAEEGAAEAAPPPPGIVRTSLPYVGWGVAGLAALLILAWALRGNAAPAAADGGLPITAGARVAEIEAALAREAGGLPPAPSAPALNDPVSIARDRARVLAGQDPNRAAAILKAWMAQEGAAQRAQHHG
ncbi:MAG: flagellar basal-body MS-ring/collar protein FliF [Anaeromyxobacter sp.]